METRILRRSGVLAAALLATAAAPARAHDGRPVPLVRQRQVGPYAVSLWATPDVGMGTFYVVIVPRDGERFVPPSTVRVAMRPSSGRLPEQVHVARPEPVRYGARFVTMFTVDRAEAWEVRVVLDGVAGGGALQAELHPMMAGPPGGAAMALYVAPFFLVAGVWGRAGRARRRHASERTTTITVH